MFYLIFSFFTIVFIFLFNKYNNIISKNKNDKKISLFFLICFIFLYVFKLFLPDSFVLNLSDKSLIFDPLKGNWIDAIIRWSNDIAFVVIPFAMFYKKKNLNKIVMYFLLPVCIINICMYSRHILFFTSPYGSGLRESLLLSNSVKDFLINKSFRSIYFGLYMFFELFLLINLSFKNKKDLYFNNFKEFSTFILSIIGLFIMVLPVYVPQYFSLINRNVKYASIYLKSESSIFTISQFNFAHFLWIFIIVFEGVLLYIFFKKYSKEDKKIFLFMMSIALSYQFLQHFSTTQLTADRFPVQLCNIAGFLLIYAFLKNSNKVFRFTITVNVIGALFAIYFCETTTGTIWNLTNVHYIVEHTKVLLIPILSLMFGLFGHLEKKGWLDVFKIYNIYYLYALIFGIIFTGLDDMYPKYHDLLYTNALFMTNKEYTSGLIPFVGPLFDINFKLFNHFTFHLGQLVLYFGFLLLCLISYFILCLIFNNRKKD